MLLNSLCVYASKHYACFFTRAYRRICHLNAFTTVVQFHVGARRGGLYHHLGNAYSGFPTIGLVWFVLSVHTQLTRKGTGYTVEVVSLILKEVVLSINCVCTLCVCVCVCVCVCLLSVCVVNNVLSFVK